MRQPRGKTSRDISDLEVCRAYGVYWDEVKDAVFGEVKRHPAQILSEMTGARECRCIAAIRRAHRRGLLESHISLRVATLTQDGVAYLALDKANPLVAQ